MLPLLHPVIRLCGTREDLSGPIIEKMVTQAGYTVIKKLLLPDERDILSKAIAAIADNEEACLILTTGGTGFSQETVCRRPPWMWLPGCPRHSRSHAGSQYENYSKGNALKGRGGDS